jgi:hypothetical protein
MNQGYQELARLLRPIEPEAFFRDTWEKRCLGVYRNDPTYYRDVFSLRDMDAVLAFTRPRFYNPDDLEPKPAPPVTFAQGWGPEEEALAPQQYPDLSAVYRAFAGGKTISIRGLQQRWPAIATLCRHFEGLFGCPVHGNLYLTPKGAQGFSAHFDTHEVFVLQIEGSKHWRLYGPARDLPLADDSTPVNRANLGPVVEEAHLRPGDFLYIPRGHVHEAFTSDCLSLHLTLGVRVFRWADLLVQALAGVANRDGRFREALPVGYLTARPGDGVRARLRELLLALADSAGADEAVDRLAGGFLAQLPALPGDFFVGEDAEEVGLDSTVERMPGMVCRAVHDEFGATLHYPGNRLDGPTRIAPLLEHIARTSRFVVRALPGALTSDSKLVLVRRLVRDRLLRLVREAEGEPK